MWNAILNESRSEIKIAKRNISNLRYAGDTTLMEEIGRSKEPLDGGEGGEKKKTGLKLNIQKTKTMTSGPITPHQIEGEKWEWWQILFSLGSKIDMDGDCCHEIKRYLLLRRKTMTNLDSLLKSREITLQKKVHRVKAMIFPVIMYGCDSWTIKMIESWRIDVFELSCWRRFLRVPWTARRPNCSTQMKSMLKIHWNTWCWSWGYSILATWYEELTHWKRPDSGKDWTPKETGVAEYGWLDSITTQWTWIWANSGK